MAFEQQYYEAESFWTGKALLDRQNQRRLDATAKLIPPDCQSLLDVGCGNGAFGHRLAETRPGLRIVGADRSKAALKHVRFESHCCSSDSLPFEDASFDCVSCLQVIEHLPFGVFEKTIAELARVTRRWLLISVPYKENIAQNITQCPECRTIFNIDLHLHSFDDEKIDHIFKAHDFQRRSSDLPDKGLRLKYIEVDQVRLRKAPVSDKFLSPICPVCGYSEGDSTMLSQQAVAIENAGPKTRSLGRRLAKQALIKYWPRVLVDGYWLVALYSR